VKSEGHFHCCLGLGGSITPPVIVTIVHRCGWRTAFWITGALTLPLKGCLLRAANSGMGVWRLDLLWCIIRLTLRTTIHPMVKLNIPRNNTVKMGRKKRSEGQSCGMYNNAVGIAKSAHSPPSVTPQLGSSQKLNFLGGIMLSFPVSRNPPHRSRSLVSDYRSRS